MKTKFHAKSFLTRECERYQSLSKKEKEKKKQICERYKNLFEDEKERLLQYRKNNVKQGKRRVDILFWL